MIQARGTKNVFESYWRRFKQSALIRSTIFLSYLQGEHQVQGPRATKSRLMYMYTKSHYSSDNEIYTVFTIAGISNHAKKT